MDKSEAPSNPYWVHIRQAGRQLGGGFLVTRRQVLTAAHCIRGVPRDCDDLTVVFAHGEQVPGRLGEVLADADLALVRLSALPDTAPRPPRVGRCRRDDAWFAPYRPGVDDPHLSGSVAHSSVDYRCEGGAMLTALQLTTSIELGDYHGYSGGPVEHRAAGEQAGVVIGVLLEQYPERVRGDRSSNVLFAAAVAEALQRFDAFEVIRMVEVMGGNAQLSPGRPTDESIARADMLLLSLRDWVERGLLEPGEARKLRMRVVKDVLDG